MQKHNHATLYSKHIFYAQYNAIMDWPEESREGGTEKGIRQEAEWFRNHQIISCSRNSPSTALTYSDMRLALRIFFKYFSGFVKLRLI